MSLSMPMIAKRTVVALMGALLMLSLAWAGPLPKADASSGCWQASYTARFKNVFGATLGTATTTGRWCVSGSTVTSATLLHTWGETSTPGWSYEGVTATGAEVVTNEDVPLAETSSSSVPAVGLSRP